jgi:hypothetical protein
METKKYCLNGEWDFMPIYDKNSLELPLKLAFESEKVRVPSIWKDRIPVESGIEEFGEFGGFDPFNMFEYPNEWNMADTGVLHRFFTVPKDMQNGRIFLRFNAIAQKSRIYLNGVAIADWDEMFLPLTVDITDSIIDGQNELTVVCTIFDEVKIPNGQIKTLGLIGSWYGYFARGIWQDVFLEFQPNIYFEDAFVTTSVKEMSINTSLKINNTTDKNKKLDIKLTISDENGIAKIIEKKAFEIPSNGEIQTSLSDSWVKPIFWDIVNPHLYKMKLELIENGEIIASKILTFGFREITMEGHVFKLNGTRINMRGDSWHFQGCIQQSKQYALNWYKMCKGNGVNYIRLHAEPHPEYYLEAADEVGMMIVDETAIYGSSGKMDAGNSVYLNQCKKHIERLVKRDRNHPCVITWSLQNEMRWVTNRDTYKLHIPEMMRKIKELDSTRPIVLDGDNRLISKENAEIESMHYNIDGTIAQWDKTKPLTFGEHGGWWYICPQNSSMYVGLKAYNDFNDCVEGVAFKEKLYVEYARKAEVSGISTFNFAHYMMRSMPNEDIRFEYDSLDTFGCKPKVLRKNSLTINNGLLKDYPLFTPNPSMEIVKAAFKPVTIIASEYNTSFYNDKPLFRSFDVYNDSFYDQNSKVVFVLKQPNGEEIYSKTFDLVQHAGEKKNLEIIIELPQLEEMEKLTLTADLFHNDVKMHTLVKEYKIYPSIIKIAEIKPQGKKIACYADGECLKIIRNFIPTCEILDGLNSINKNYDMLIIGNNISEYADKYQAVLEKFTADGGMVVILEQPKFALGDLHLTSQPFFSAHIGDKNHKILHGFEDQDFMFWKPYTKEETPLNIIENCFEKPIKGDVNMLLECSAGDFGDGGDLWTPLMEYSYKKGTMLINQLEIISHYETAPQACVLLRNMLEYAIEKSSRVKVKTAVIAENSEIQSFISKTGLEFDNISVSDDFSSYEILIVDISNVDSSENLRRFAENGGKVLVLPVDKADKLENVINTKVKITNIPTYHLKTATLSNSTVGFSICDLFGYDKVHLSPRLVTNKPICQNTIEIDNAENLLMSVTGTPWYDYYVNDLCQEYRRIALVSMNEEKKEPEKPYLAKFACGSGEFIISQITIDNDSDKSQRLYSRLFANLGAFVTGNAFSYHKLDADYAVEFFMTLPHEEYKDYKAEEAYYTDKEYSLNNLGEGLYGWMNKVERNRNDGFITIPNSQGRICFLTCFVEWGTSGADFINCAISINANCSFKIWINGELCAEQSENKDEGKAHLINDITLQKGVNRLVINATSDKDEIRLRPVFKTTNGDYLDHLRYKLTIDEVDPK